MPIFGIQAVTTEQIPKIFQKCSLKIITQHVNVPRVFSAFLKSEIKAKTKMSFLL